MNRGTNKAKNNRHKKIKITSEQFIFSIYINNFLDDVFSFSLDFSINFQKGKIFF
jgi:hypothetical protein